MAVSWTIAEKIILFKIENYDPTKNLCLGKKIKTTTTKSLRNICSQFVIFDILETNNSKNWLIHVCPNLEEMILSLDITKDKFREKQYFILKLSRKNNSGNVLFSFYAPWFIGNQQNWKLLYSIFRHRNQILFCLGLSTKLLYLTKKIKTKTTSKQFLFLSCDLWYFASRWLWKLVHFRLLEAKGNVFTHIY